MTSTFCAMNDRMAAIWFSCLPWASTNFSSMPAAAADSWIDLVLAVRQPLSAPTCAKPITILPSSAAAFLLLHAVPTDSTVTALSAINANLLSTAPSLEWGSQLLAPGGVVSVNILLRRQQGRAIGRSTWCVCGLLLGACPRW